MPRLPKNYKNQLDTLNADKRREAKLREKAFPLRLAQKASIPDARKQKIWDRLLKLSDYYDKTRAEAMWYRGGFTIQDFNANFDLNMLHAEKDQWFSGNLEYRYDCVIVGAKLLINYLWAETKGDINLISHHLWQFPVIDTVIGEGPVFPPSDEVFYPADEHVIVSEGGDLFFVPFEDRKVEDVYHMEVLSA